VRNIIIVKTLENGLIVYCCIAWDLRDPQYGYTELYWSIYDPWILSDLNCFTR